jgi:putative DNA primase/helicase
MWPASVLARFERLTPLCRPQTWKARCPAHDDRTPSLGLWVGRNGALLIRCWARHGCTLGAILEAKGLTMRDLFPDQDDRSEPKRHGAAWQEAPKRRVVATYDYRDEVGQLLYQAIRYEPKGFNQRRPDPTFKDGWSWALGNVRRVLYRLPELLGAPRLPVLVVEGEKDADALVALRLLATTNVGGTGMGWRDDYSRSLAGRRVVVLPDNDLVGREHGYLVAGSLVYHGAASVRLLSLPHLPDRGDVSDWLASGGNRERLCELIKAAPEWAPFSRATRTVACNLKGEPDGQSK